MKHLFYITTILLLAVCVSVPAVAQDQSAPDKAIKLFKDHINKAKSNDMKKLLMDVDDPNIVLLTSNYDRMEDAMQTYIEAWKGKTFQLYNITTKGANSGIVYMWSPQTLDQIKFYMVNIRVGKDRKWFIRDTEVFENASYAGDEGEIIP